MVYVEWKQTKGHHLLTRSPSNLYNRDKHNHEATYMYTSTLRRLIVTLENMLHVLGGLPWYQFYWLTQLPTSYCIIQLLGKPHLQLPHIVL